MSIKTSCNPLFWLSSFYNIESESNVKLLKTNSTIPGIKSLILAKL